MPGEYAPKLTKSFCETPAKPMFPSSRRLASFEDVEAPAILSADVQTTGWTHLQGPSHEHTSCFDYRCPDGYRPGHRDRLRQGRGPVGRFGAQGSGRESAGGRVASA